MHLNFTSGCTRSQALAAFISCCFFANLGKTQSLETPANDSDTNESDTNESDTNESVTDESVTDDTAVKIETSQPSGPSMALPVRDNDPHLKHSVTPYQWRFSLDIGDQAGGPVRYNTRFPDDAVDPNPGSYYHAQAFAGVSVEYAFSKGVFQWGLFTRRDIAHGNIAGRTYSSDGRLWTVDKFAFKSDGVAIGWVLGRAVVADRARLSISLKEDKNLERTVDVSMWAASLRSRVMFRMLGKDSLDLHIGPELHVPIYAHTTKPSLDSEEGRLAQIADVKNSAAIGLMLEMGLKG
ncbi:MAG: hypothetical protein NTV34_07190 [Proteobacteria bacterium]|nr:hypothetical protein [Pseudomonadota bacterium]